jgi:hypothetical protein
VVFQLSGMMREDDPPEVCGSTARRSARTAGEDTVQVGASPSPGCQWPRSTHCVMWDVGQVKQIGKLSPSSSVTGVTWPCM